MKDTYEFDKPGTITECVNRFHELDRAREKLARELDTIKSEISEMKLYIVNKYANEHSSKEEFKGASHKVVVAEKARYSVSDTTLFHAYIVEHGAFDLLQKRLSDPAIKIRLEDAIPLPFIKRYMQKVVTIKKI